LTSGSGYIDLHVHSNHSDGLKSVEEIVCSAAERGLRALSLTDHDVTTGLAEAIESLARHGVEIVPGLEISSYCDGLETHLLGYFIDPLNPALTEFSNNFRRFRTERAREILHKLTQQGIDIPFELLQLRAGHSSIGRPHIADLLVEEGVVFSFQEAFNKFLAEHRPAYVPKIKVNADEAIALIHAAGGLAVVAHPAVGVTDAVIHRLIACGLDGLETLHPKHQPYHIQHYQELAAKTGLVESGGSDCHGARQGELMLGCMMVPYHYLEKLKSRLASRTVSVSRTG